MAVLRIAETIELELETGARIFVSASELGGFQVIGESSLFIEPRMENSIRIVIEPSTRERKLRGSHD